MSGIVSVCSYNIHRCKGTDGRCNPSRTAEVLREVDASILGLQEVHSTASGEPDSSHLHFLANAIGGYFVTGPTVSRGHSHYGNALLTRFPIIEVRHLDLSVNSREPRAAIDVILNVDGTMVQVVVTHLGLRNSERCFQVRKLTEHLRLHSPTILLGDMNEWLPIARPLWWIRREFGTYKALKTFPSRLPVFALDRIWVRPKEALQEISVHDTPASRIASDHLPLKATLRIE